MGAMVAETGNRAPSPEMVEGPYYANGGPRRSDIREDQPGLALDLTIVVRDAGTGTALAGVDVDLWHPNATGRYSGYDVDPDAVPDDIGTGQPPTNTETFLRGRQTTDARGRVRFSTVYPGWYRLRTPHMHLKVFEGAACNLTTQLYSPEAVSNRVYARSEYARTADQDTFNGADSVIATTPGDMDSLWVEIDDTQGGLTGTAEILIVQGNVNRPIHPPPGRIPPVGGRPHDKPVR